jgi:hypothetical protein
LRNLEAHLITDDALNAEQIPKKVKENMKNRMQALNSLRRKNPHKHKKYFEHAKLLLGAIKEDQVNWSSSDVICETEDPFEYK